MKHELLITSLYRIGAIQFGEFKLKSGQMSSIYINLRKIISYPDILRTVAKLMWEATIDCQFDLICGVPYTALPIATCISLEHNVPMIMRRKEKKDYGTKQTIEGVFTPGQRCLVVEDVVTSGSSILETTLELENAGVQVRDLVALIDREQGGRDTLSTRYKLNTIVTMTDILETLLRSDLVPDNERSIIEQFIASRSTQ